MRLIPPTVKLGFEPNHVTDPKLQSVIADEIAWAIWLLWKPFHIVSESFNANCLNAAERIRARKPGTMREYALCFGGHDFGIEDVDNWISQAYPYLTGQAKIHIEVKVKT